jgi:hypothetical protein
MTTVLQLFVASGLIIAIAAALLAVSARAAFRWSVRRVRRALSARMRAFLSSGSTSATGNAIAGRRAGLPGVTAGRPVGSATGVRVRACIPAPGRDVAVIRRDLRRDVQGAERAVVAGLQAHRPVEGLHLVMGRLADQARALDVDLTIIGNEPDRRARQYLLTAQDERLALLRKACGEVRRAVLLAGSISTMPLLQSMENDLNDEVIALALQTRAYAELSRR